MIRRFLAALRVGLAIARLQSHQAHGWRWVVYPGLGPAGAPLLYVCSIWHESIGCNAQRIPFTGATPVDAMKKALHLLDTLRRRRKPIRVIRASSQAALN